MNNRLTIEYGRLALHGARHASDGGKAISPIMTVASKHTDTIRLDQHLGAIAVMLDFVNPVFALGRLVNERGKLGLNEP